MNTHHPKSQPISQKYNPAESRRPHSTITFSFPPHIHTFHPSFSPKDHCTRRNSIPNKSPPKSFIYIKRKKIKEKPSKPATKTEPFTHPIQPPIPTSKITKHPRRKKKNQKTKRTIIPSPNHPKTKSLASCITLILFPSHPIPSPSHPTPWPTPIQSTKKKKQKKKARERIKVPLRSAPPGGRKSQRNKRGKYTHHPVRKIYISSLYVRFHFSLYFSLYFLPKRGAGAT